MANKLEEQEYMLDNDNRTLKEIIQEIADEEGMTYDETLKLFLKGLKENNSGLSNRKSKEQLKKDKKKRKLAKASRKKNRK